MRSNGPLDGFGFGLPKELRHKFQEWERDKHNDLQETFETQLRDDHNPQM